MFNLVLAFIIVSYSSACMPRSQKAGDMPEQMKQSLGIRCEMGVPNDRLKEGPLLVRDIDALAAVYRQELTPLLAESFFVEGRRTEVGLSLGTHAEQGIVPSDSLCYTLSTRHFKVVPLLPVPGPACRVRLVGWLTRAQAVVWWEIKVVDSELRGYSIGSSSLVTRTPHGWKICTNGLYENS